MRIKVLHETVYSYGVPARSALQLLRMTPRSFDGHFVRRWRVEIDTDARLDRDEDAYGNITHMVFIEGPVDSVRVTVEGEVDTSDTGGVVRGTVERLPLMLYLRESPLTILTPQLRSLADGIGATDKSGHLATLHRLLTEINRNMTFMVGTTTSATTADEAFSARRGVCQDFAHVFVTIARALDIPARYVSGYFLRTDRADQDAGHAWAEAYVADLGWVGFDPANGVSTTERYVRIATGADYLEAAPIRGARIGGADETLAVAVNVAQGRGIIDQ
ncbi:MAG: transglutaminase domain-containing protein [Hyphomicrobiaceae bacterium]